MNEKWQK